MDSDLLQRQSSRREMLRNSASFAAGALLAQLLPGSLLRAVPAHAQQAAAPATGPLVRRLLSIEKVQT